MTMHNPPHPGEIIREDCLKPLNLSVTAAAEWLGVSRQSLSELLNGRNGVSAEMAIWLEKAGWSNADPGSVYMPPMISGMRSSAPSPSR